MDDILDVVASARRLLVVRQITAREYIFYFKDMDSKAEDALYLRPDNQQILANNAAFIDEYYREIPTPNIVSPNAKMYERIEHEHSTPN